MARRNRNGCRKATAFFVVVPDSPLVAQYIAAGASVVEACLFGASVRLLLCSYSKQIGKGSRFWSADCGPSSAGDKTFAASSCDTRRGHARRDRAAADSPLVHADATRGTRARWGGNGGKQREDGGYERVWRAARRPYAPDDVQTYGVEPRQSGSALSPIAAVRGTAATTADVAAAGRNAARGGATLASARVLPSIQ